LIACGLTHYRPSWWKSGHLYQKHVCVGNNKAWQSDRQKELEDEFSELMMKLFDISHADSDHIIRIEEDRQFLEDQRGDRKMKRARRCDPSNGGQERKSETCSIAATRKGNED